MRFEERWSHRRVQACVSSAGCVAWTYRVDLARRCVSR